MKQCLVQKLIPLTADGSPQCTMQQRVSMCAHGCTCCNKTTHPESTTPTTTCPAAATRDRSATLPPAAASIRCTPTGIRSPSFTSVLGITGPVAVLLMPVPPPSVPGEDSGVLTEHLTLAGDTARAISPGFEPHAPNTSSLNFVCSAVPEKLFGVIMQPDTV